MQETYMTGTKTWTIVGILVVILALAVFFARGEKSYSPTLVEGVLGIQGAVTAVDLESRTLTLDYKRLNTQKDGTFEIDEKTYSVSWDDSTIFLTYANIADISVDNTIEASVSDLTGARNIIVSPAKLDKSTNAVTAREIRILPEFSAQ